MRVAVLGLGRIGGGVVRALAGHGHELVGYDVSAEAAAAVPELAHTAASPREAATGADVVFVAVFDDAQVRDVLTGDGSALAAGPPPGAVVILSTVTADTIRWAGDEAGRRGIPLLDCGVTGGRAIEHGAIAAMVGGDESTLEAVRPAIEGFASPVVYMGPLGSGMRAKLARNMIVFGCWYVAWEAARLAAAAGIDVAKLAEVSVAGDRWSGGPTGLLVQHGIGPGAADPADEAGVRQRQMLAAYAHKDLHAALELAAELGVELPGAVLVEERFDAAVGLPDG